MQAAGHCSESGVATLHRAGREEQQNQPTQDSEPVEKNNAPCEGDNQQRGGKGGKGLSEYEKKVMERLREPEGHRTRVCRGGKGGGGFSFVACLRPLILDHTSLSRRCTRRARGGVVLDIMHGGGGVLIVIHVAVVV